MSDAERLARAVLLFFSQPPWTPEKRAEWTEITGNYQCTSVVLCDLARQMTPTAGRIATDLWQLGDQIAKAEEVCAQEYTRTGKVSKEAEDRLVALKAELNRQGGNP